MRAVERDLLGEVDPDQPEYLANDRGPGSCINEVAVLLFEELSELISVNIHYR